MLTILFVFSGVSLLCVIITIIFIKVLETQEIHVAFIVMAILTFIISIFVFCFVMYSNARADFLNKTYDKNYTSEEIFFNGYFIEEHLIEMEREIKSNER